MSREALLATNILEIHDNLYINRNLIRIENYILIISIYVNLVVYN